MNSLRISHQIQSNHQGKKPKWIHIGILKIKSKKIPNSKSNTITINNFLNKYSTNILKILFLHEIYNKDFSFDKRKMRKAILMVYEISSYFTAEFVKNGNFIETVNESNIQRHRVFENLEQLLKHKIRDQLYQKVYEI